MTFIDLALLIFVGGFTLAGFWFGLIHMIGSFLSFVLGVYAAGRYYDELAAWGSATFGGSLNAWTIASVFILFVLVGRLVGVLFWFIDKLFRFIAIIPFLKTFNRLLGAALGFLEGLIALGLVVYFASRFPFSAGFAEMLRGSQVARWLALIGELLAPLLPAAVRAVRSVL